MASSVISKIRSIALCCSCRKCF